MGIMRGQRGALRNPKKEEKDPEIEKALNQWFCALTGRGLRVSGPMLKSQKIFLTK
jgi:hypothetical protein